MNKMYFLGCMGILAASAMLSSCSSDNDDPTPSPNPGSEVVYKWTTNGGLKACDHILFGTDDKENANGTQIGNGDQEFVFTGKQTLKKGTYLLALPKPIILSILIFFLQRYCIFQNILLLLHRN